MVEEVIIDIRNKLSDKESKPADQVINMRALALFAEKSLNIDLISDSKTLMHLNHVLNQNHRESMISVLKVVWQLSGSEILRE